jgi:hypothetical protein
MSDLLRKIEAVRVRAAEDAVISSLPARLVENMRKADAAFKSSGGCPGCGSQVIGVHYGDCPSIRNDLY